MEHTPEPAERRFRVTTSSERLTPRTELVDATIQLLRESNIILIRAPPQTGKTTLANLMCRKMLLKHPDLEPVFFAWDEGRSKPGGQHTESYMDVLERQLREAKSKNEDARKKLGLQPNNAKPVYMIDDAIYTYSEKRMWEEVFKGEVKDRNVYYILICVHGSSTGFYQWGTDYSNAVFIPTDRRVELLPDASYNLQLRMNEEETKIVIDRWAAHHTPPAKCDQSVYEFVRCETEGYPGILNIMLEYIKMHTVGLFLNPNT
ncbi:MAG: hypothetical protein L6R38_006514 [Xanthoria sp. 2 TBL-2021]|nr:MAG: hypothetical protein L6R38_006514 [Xanthoria sp. 2 TBL-2021]